MPRISSFYGIVITMYFDDHERPHFHAERGEYKAKVERIGFEHGTTSHSLRSIRCHEDNTCQEEAGNDRRD